MSVGMTFGGGKLCGALFGVAGVCGVIGVVIGASVAVALVGVSGITGLSGSFGISGSLGTSGSLAGFGSTFSPQNVQNLELSAISRPHLVQITLGSSQYLCHLLIIKKMIPHCPTCPVPLSHVINDIAYAGEPEPLLKVVGVKPLDDYKLWLRFSNHEVRTYDIKPLFEYPLFSKLKDLEAFKDVYLDYGVPTWLDGEIDISPETLFSDGVDF